jgi:hypothetical protein
MVPNLDFDDKDRADVMLNHFPHGVSLKTIVHLGQMIAHQSFKRFDYLDPSLNLAHYGEETPPVINPYQKSKVPIAIFAAENDATVALGDVEELVGYLGEAVTFYKKYSGDHLTF